LAWANITQTSGQVYNIGGGAANAISPLMLVEYLKKEVNPSLEIRYSCWRPGDQHVYISDITKARKYFGWSPNTSWGDGITKLVHWVTKHRKSIKEHIPNTHERSHTGAMDALAVLENSVSTYVPSHEPVKPDVSSLARDSKRQQSQRLL
jgi:dTDP-D-glucose 4,6-dehydratase